MLSSFCRTRRQVFWIRHAAKEACKVHPSAVSRGTLQWEQHHAVTTITFYSFHAQSQTRWAQNQKCVNVVLPNFLQHLNISRMRVHFHSRGLNQHLLPTERPTDASQSMPVGLTGRGLIYYSQTKPERLNLEEGKYFLTPLRMKAFRIHPSLWHFPPADLISNTPALTDLKFIGETP